MKRPGRKEDRSNPHSRSRVNVASMSGSQFGSSRMSVVRASQALLGKLKAPEVNVTVLDDDGFDVTPLSLLGASKGIANKAAVLPAAVESSVVTRETVADVLNNLESLNSSSWANSGFGRSGMSQTSKTSQSENSEDEDDATSSVGSVDSIYEKDDLRDKVRYRLSIKAEQLENDPNKYVHINLAETDTITLFDLPSLSVSNEATEDVQVVKTANARYKDLKSIKANNDNYLEKGMQTFNNAKKNKDVQATAQKFEDAEVMANVWSIFDALNTGDVNKNEEGQKDNEESITHPVAGDSSLGSMALPSGLSSSNMINSKTVFANEDGISETMYTSINTSHVSDTTGISGQEPATITVIEKDLSQLNQKNLLASLFLMEKAVVSNVYEKKLISYRDIIDVEAMEEKRLAYLAKQAQRAEENGDENSDLEDQNELIENDQTEYLETASFAQSLQLLWCYRCELTRGREVMNMTFNKVNEDILAVAYGKNTSVQSEDSGLILVWSIKNPDWPERQYSTTSSVTALDFSHKNPNLLAAGFQDGRVIIYDVRTKTASQILEAGLKHHDPVWEMKWIQKETISSDDQTEGEYLVSVSTDGRVTQWQIRKGLESTNLMLLKSANKSASGSAPKVSSFISRQSGGLCFDFHKNDSNTFIVGTEDGFIHRCSSSYNEQYLESYSGHSGPVYKVKWSPFLSNIFLSCSADWTIRLWSEEEDTDIFRFQNGKDAVTDIAWSPTESAIFGCVSSEGRLELWDLRHSVLDPMLVQTVLDRQLTSITFGSESSVILSGDNNGVVNVYKLVKGNGQDESKSKISESTRFEQKASLLHSIIKTKLTNSTSSSVAGKIFLEKIMDVDKFDNQNSLILGVYRSFEEAGVSNWRLGSVPSYGKKYGTKLHDLKDSQYDKSKDKVYIYAVDYHPIYNSSSTRRFSETSPTDKPDNDCRSSVLEPTDEIMDEASNISDNSLYSEPRLDVSNNNSGVSENTSNDLITTNKLNFEVSNSNSTEYECTEGSNHISNYTKCSSTTAKSSIKIMIVDQTKKRNLSTALKSEQELISQSKTNHLKKAKLEKKQKILKVSEDPLQLRKTRHMFTGYCEVCGPLSDVIPPCKFHNDEKYLFYRRKRLSLSENEEAIKKIDQLLPKTYQLISCDHSNNINIVSSLTTQWQIDFKEPRAEQKKAVDLRPVYKFFKDFFTV